MIYPDGTKKFVNPIFKLGDVVRDSMSGMCGRIKKIQWVKPGNSPQCFYVLLWWLSLCA